MLKKLLIKKKFLIAILVIGIFFRIHNLSSVPPSPSLDEASIGYNAYSILLNGKDEYGTFFPLLLRAYDDYRPALYVYLVVPFIALFNLNILAVRLPSVILSISTLVAVYFLIKELIPKVSFKGKNINGETISLLTTFLLAISPWHIYLSRLGHEVNAGYSFFIFGLLFVLRKNIYLSAFFFVLSFISYQTEKIFIPLFCLMVGILYGKELLQKWKKILIASIIGGIILVPFVIQSLSDDGLLRFKGTNILEANKSRFDYSAQQLVSAKEEKNVVKQVFYNRRITTLQIVGEAYVSHFNPKWLFFNTGSESHKIPYLGLFFVWEFPFMIIGLFVLFKVVSKRTALLFILWILFAPLSSSITTDAPHAMRSVVLLPTFQILTALGLISAYIILMRFRLYKIVLGIFVFLCIVSTGVLYHNYFNIFPKMQSSSFQYALHDTIQYVLGHEKEYDKVIFSNRESMYQSYMFYLYNAKFDPMVYQQIGGTKSGGYAETHTFDKYEFRPVNLTEEKLQPKYLYIVNASDVLGNQKVLKTFKNLNGKEAIKIVVK